MFALQIALLKDRGGVDAAVLHYARMFDALGVGHAALYRGAGAGDLAAAGVPVLAAPEAVAAPWFALTPAAHRLRADIAARAGGARSVVILHSDRALGAARAIAPHAPIVAPCHSDKAKHKRRADLVVTLNPAQHALVTRTLAGSRARAALLGNPFVEPPRAPPAAPGPLRLNFCARFIPTKDPLTLLRAAALARSAPPLRLIGAGPLEQQMRDFLSLSPMEAEFPGWRADPFADFTSGDVLVLPSLWEGLPYLLQEALARGVPVIAADNAGNRQALDGGAFGALFPCGDVEALAGAIDAAGADLDGLRAKALKGRAALAARYGAAPFWARLQDALAQGSRS